ncbi:putative apoptosis-inducing factor 1, mitochondrial isoform X1 [Stomoxys calcitrans]|uniref:putative apoptosis-inducing factor 1, mitochondrial isoform X1 n=1 Tax=Stomoxys calcitrans TaxID=35570 RepID=UPI0027E2AF99|nr:putative apoptosis-inducing factor 1, mitochondrial isoform X1 [Stomoxys calcitrans]XP_013097869.2 putative apoptosis-inducing factor 1, mitochondrial isoform X1 [Stomoxys calcitrans]
MSICSLKGSHALLCRRAFILASGNRTIPPQIMLAQTVPKRDSHSALYQMVKKRKVNARANLQANAYPPSKKTNPNGNQQYSELNITSENTKSSLKTKFLTECASTSSSISPASKLNSNAFSQNPRKTAQDLNKELCRQKFSLNTEVLRAANCNISRKASAESKSTTVSTDPKTISGAPPGGDKSNGKTKPLILVVAAALGVGGLVYYFMNEKSTTPPPPKSKSLPPSSADLPKHVPYLLIGGGTAAFSAFRAIKSNDAKAKVLMITDEHRKPYMRPPLSKELWYTAQQGEISEDYRFKQWTGAERSLYFEPEEFFIEPAKLNDSPNGGIAVAQGFKVTKVDPTKRIATLSDGYEISYDECLIATGCTPKNLQIFLDAPPAVKERVMIYRNPEDFEKLKKYMDANKNVTIIGNGFIGSELSCSLANYNKNKKDGGGRIFQVFPETANMSKILPDYLSKWTMEKVQSQGVCVVPNASIKSVQRDQSQLKLHLSTGETVLTDVVLVCVGCEANTDIAQVSGLEVDSNLGGFVVNAELEARRNLFVAGDCSCFFDPLLGRRRVEHHDHSVTSGRLAGENMVGKKKPYTHQSMFWSDLGPEIGYEGIGLIDSSLPTVGVFSLPSKADRQTDNLSENRGADSENKTPTSTNRELADVKCSDEQKENYGRGVIFYLKEEKIVGILLWNIFNRVGLARTVINQNKKFDDLNEVAKLFEIHS